MANKSTDFTFIDLFAGIGGLRIPFQEIGGRCVFSSELDKFARETYSVNFGEMPFGDITDPKTTQAIPDNFDLLLAGFPCQPFSLAGVVKRESLLPPRPHGFDDPKNGTMFLEIEKILRSKRPRLFVLENVRNLVRHDKGKTYKTIIKKLVDLNYLVDATIIKASCFLPQKRERLVILGFDKHEFKDLHLDDSHSIFDNLIYPEKALTMKDILHTEDGTEKLGYEYKEYLKSPSGKVDRKYTLTLGVWKALQRHKKKHGRKGNGFGYNEISSDSTNCRTLSARYYKDGAEILVKRENSKIPRRLTPRECARLMGFKDTFKIPVSDVQAYKQFGNSVAIPVFDEVARIIKPYLLRPRCYNINTQTPD